MTMINGLLIGLIVIAFYQDVRYHIIPNWLTITGSLTGLLFHMIHSGWSGFLFALLGGIGGFGIVFLLYMLKAVGAGDVKLFGAIGALGGFSYAMGTLIYSVMLAAIIGVLILIIKQRIVTRLVHSIMLMLISSNVQFISWVRKKYAQSDVRALDGMHRFPFMLAVAPAIIIINLMGIPGVI